MFNLNPLKRFAFTNTQRLFSSATSKRLFGGQNGDDLNKLQRICITGGPCAGKTTILTKLTNVLETRGFKVFNVPEAASMLHGAGVILDTSRMSEEQQIL